MIGKLRGLVDTIAEDHVVLDVGGVGYEVFCPARVLGHLPRPGEPVSLVIETVVREDAIRLYGFTSPGERAWFRLLTSVQGVGAKVALAILGVLAPDDLATAIALGDKVALSRAPGVGKRLAERLVVELKQAAGELALPAALAGSGGVQIAAGSADPALSDAVSALVNLGYGEAQARGAVLAARAAGHAEAGAATLIRQALKELAR
jgi:Holliday junction DNA helicase RuvA